MNARKAAESEGVPLRETIFLLFRQTETRYEKSYRVFDCIKAQSVKKVIDFSLYALFGYLLVTRPLTGAIQSHGMPYLTAGQNKRKGSALLSAAAAALFLKGETVCTLGNRRVCLVCANAYTVKSTVMFAVHIVLAGYYITFDRRVFHSIISPFFGESVTLRILIFQYAMFRFSLQFSRYTGINIICRDTAVMHCKFCKEKLKIFLEKIKSICYNVF